MAKNKSKLRRQVETETKTDFDCVYEFYQYQNGKKQLFDRITNASQQEANAYLRRLYREHRDAAFTMEIKTLNFRDLTLANA